MTFLSPIDLVRKEPMPGFVGRFAHGITMTVVQWTVEAGAKLPEHAHPHEQVSYVLEGEFELTIEGRTQRLHQGALAIVPPNITHSGLAVTKCRLLDVFHPVRDDYR